MNWYDRVITNLKDIEDIGDLITAILGIAVLLCIIFVIMSLFGIVVILTVTNKLPVGLFWAGFISLVGIVIFGGFYALAADKL